MSAKIAAPKKDKAGAASKNITLNAILPNILRPSSPPHAIQTRNPQLVNNCRVSRTIPKNPTTPKIATSNNRMAGIGQRDKPGVSNVGCCTQMEAAPPMHIIAPIPASIHSIMRFMVKLLSSKSVRTPKVCDDYAIALPTICSAAVPRTNHCRFLPEASGWF